MCIPGVCWVIVWCCNYGVWEEERRRKRRGEERREEGRGEERRGLIHCKGISTFPPGLALLFREDPTWCWELTQKRLLASVHKHAHLRYNPRAQKYTNTTTQRALHELTWLLCWYTLLTVFQCEGGTMQKKMCTTGEGDEKKEDN